jgi:Iap family predicted aminopeptidase
MTFDLRQDRILGIEEAVRTAGILRAETQNAISIVFPTMVNDTSGHVTRLTIFYWKFCAFLVRHVILNVYGTSSSGLFLSKYI